MQKQVVSVPGYRSFEYLLVIQPHEELRNQLLSIKKEFADKYKASAALHIKPHLLLVRFTALQMLQERIVNRIGNMAMGMAPFKIEVNGFRAFPSHTIYAAVTIKVPLQAVVKELKAAAPLMTLYKGNKPHFMEEPHFTICSKLKPWQFEQGWLEYSHRHFSGRFIADSLTLLRRPEDEMKYEAIMRFEFQDLAVNTKQGSLFM